MLHTSCTDRDCLRAAVWLEEPTEEACGCCFVSAVSSSTVGSAKADAGGHSSPSLTYSPVYCTAITALRGGQTIEGHVFRHLHLV